MYICTLLSAVLAYLFVVVDQSWTDVRQGSAAGMSGTTTATDATPDSVTLVETWVETGRRGVVDHPLEVVRLVGEGRPVEDDHRVVTGLRLVAGHHSAVEEEEGMVC